VRLRAGIWLLIGGAVVLATRTISYALAPQSVLLAALAHGGGGPNLAAALIGAVLAAAAIAAAVLWLAVGAVRERLSLEGRRLARRPRLRPWLLAGRAVAFFLATSFAFAMVESTIHWRDGLGWHGLSCLVGPVHRDAIPILAGLTLVAVAVHGAIEHLLEWARRLVAQLAARPRAVALPFQRAAVLDRPRPRSRGNAAAARGPPGLFASVLSS
jgi:hypothetical protein